jgi:hypothetical protein
MMLMKMKVPTKMKMVALTFPLLVLRVKTIER